MIRLATLTETFGRIGVLSFGGPAAQIALMHDTLVTQKKWLTEAEYLRALSLCMLLPGPEAMQLATYAGWRLRGVLGGVIAGGLFVLPGALVITALAMIYISYGTQPTVIATFTGIQAAVIITVLQALLRLSRKALRDTAAWVLAGGAFVALFAFALQFPLVIAAAGLFGYFSAQEKTSAPTTAQATPTSLRAQISTALLWGGLWASPIVLIAVLDHAFLTQIGLFFSKLAVVTFGGAYAVLAYMTQTVVQTYGWIETSAMIDALGLAETTPGPLILVTQFVAILAGAAQGGLPLGLIAGALALWVTFVPCFLWIFLAAPHLEQLATRPRLSAALEAITAAVVGVILNLSLWFALHVLFAQVEQLGALPAPVWQSLDINALVLTGLAALLILWRGLSLPVTLLITAPVGAALGLLGPALL